MADSPFHPSATDVRRYYRSPRDGEVTGPFTRAEIDAAIARGEVNASTLLCVEGSTAWQSASVLLFGMRDGGDGRDGGAAAAPPSSSSAVGVARDVDPSRRAGILGPIIASVLSLILCCLPIGAIALIYAFIANAKFEAGDIDGGQRAERTARGWLIATWILLALSCVINVWLSYAMLDAVDDMFDQLTRMR